MTAFRADAERVGALIAAARRLLGAGKTVDLAALKGRVQVLCSGLAGSPPQDQGERLEAQSLLGHLLQDLDGLERDLAARCRDAIPDPLRQRASRAYETLGGPK